MFSQLYMPSCMYYDSRLSLIPIFRFTSKANCHDNISFWWILLDSQIFGGLSNGSNP